MVKRAVAGITEGTVLWLCEEHRALLEKFAETGGDMREDEFKQKAWDIAAGPKGETQRKVRSLQILVVQAEGIDKERTDKPLVKVVWSPDNEKKVVHETDAKKNESGKPVVYNQKLVFDIGAGAGVFRIQIFTSVLSKLIAEAIVDLQTALQFSESRQQLAVQVIDDKSNKAGGVVTLEFTAHMI